MSAIKYSIDVITNGDKLINMHKGYCSDIMYDDNDIGYIDRKYLLSNSIKASIISIDVTINSLFEVLRHEPDNTNTISILEHNQNVKKYLIDKLNECWILHKTI